MRRVADCVRIHGFRLGRVGEGGFGGGEDVEGVEGFWGRGARGYIGWVGVGSVMSVDVGVDAVIVVRVLVFVCVVGECGRLVVWVGGIGVREVGIGRGVTCQGGGGETQEESNWNVHRVWWSGRLFLWIAFCSGFPMSE